MSERELDRLERRHRDIYKLGDAAPDRDAARIERQLRMKTFASKHRVKCFKCGASHKDWAKTGMAAHGAWGICLQCVRSK